MSSGSVTRLWRQLHPGDNPLVRRWDRIESRLLLVVAVLAVLTVPGVAAIGSSVYTHQLAIVADQQASRSPATAVLREDAPAATQRMVRGSPATAAVSASWVSPNGLRRQGTVPAPYGAVQGTKVEIWLDADGDLTSPPLTPHDAAAFAISTTVAAWLAFVLALAGACCGVHARLNRDRYADWEREWRRISSDSIWP